MYLRICTMRKTLDFSFVRQFDAMCKDSIKYHFNNIMYEKNIFSDSNELYRIGLDNHNIGSKIFTKSDEQVCLNEINALISQIKLDLEYLIANDTNDTNDAKNKRIFYWSYAERHFLSDSIYKVYLKILFEENYVYSLFGNRSDVNVWRVKNICNTQEIIQMLFSHSNDLYVEGINIEEL